MVFRRVSSSAPSARPKAEEPALCCRCTTQAMALHLAEIATMVAPGAHAILVLEGRMAYRQGAFRPAQHHAGPAARQVPGAEPGRKHLAVHARQLAFEPRLHVLRRHRRPLLLRLEQAHRPTLEDHVHRYARLALWVLIRETWYKSHADTCDALCFLVVATEALILRLSTISRRLRKRNGPSSRNSLRRHLLRSSV